MEFTSRYAEAYRTFLKYMNYGEAMEGWVRQTIPDLVNCITKKNTSLEGVFRVLSIGPGTGIPDAPFLDEIQALNQSIRYTAVEPNRELLKQFRTNIALNPKYHQVDFQLREMTAQDFLTSDDHGEKYNLILFIHSLYYIMDRDGTTWRGYYNKLQEGGHIVAVTGSGEIGLSSFLKDFRGQMARADLTHAGEIDSILIKEKINCIRKSFEYFLQMAPILEGTEDGDFILDLMAHTPNFRQVSPPSVVADFLDALKDLSFERENRLVLLVKAIAYIISKE